MKVNEQEFMHMPKKNYSRPAQIAIFKDRLRYLTDSEYLLSKDGRWIMFPHPGHFLVYEYTTRYCIFDATYLVFSDRSGDDDLIAVINEMVINQDETQCPKDMKDDFGTLAELIENGL